MWYLTYGILFGLKLLETDPINTAHNSISVDLFSEFVW